MAHVVSSSVGVKLIFKGDKTHAHRAAAGGVMLRSCGGHAGVTLTFQATDIQDMDPFVSKNQANPKPGTNFTSSSQ